VAHFWFSPDGIDTGKDRSLKKSNDVIRIYTYICKIKFTSSYVLLYKKRALTPFF